MKKHLLFFLLLITAVSSAQIVNIPDANFKSLLLQSGDPGFTDIAKDENNNTLAIDANNDGEIQISEAESVWHININMQGTVSSIEGINAFINLRTLRLKNNPVENIDVTSLEFLENLTCGNYNNSEDLTMLNVTGMSTLKELHCSDNNLTVLDLTGVSNIEYLSCKNSSISSVIMDENVNLKTIDLSETAITTLDLTGYVNLENLQVNEVPLANLILTGCTSLEELNFASTILSSIDISTCVALETVECGGYGDDVLQSITIGNLPNLLSFHCNHASFTELDFTGCPSLSSLICLGMENTLFIDLKNGGFTDNITLGADNEEANIFICIDEGEEANFPSFVLNNPILHFSSYCSFTPGGNYNTITGNFTFDGDNNGCDTGDNFGNIVRVNINDGTESGSTFSNNNGNYNFYTEAGTFTLTPNIENNDWFTISPTSATVTFADDNNNTETQNFCITPNGEHPDVEVVIVPIVPAQPGFNATYKITYRNKGNQTLSGSVSLSYNDAVLDYVSSTSGVTTSGNVFAWNYNNLQPFETRNINLTLNVNSPMEDPAVNIDDLLVFTANVTPITGDETPENNTFTLAQTVVGSYDPNDITCLEGEAVNMIHIGEYLHYNINFENTGTAPATFIVVKNEINEEQFDISTLQLMDASHNVETRITGNTVEFYFGDINLAANGGKGNVLYKIKTLSTLLPEDTVTQQANIFFDYNFPIETNEANTTFATLSNTVFTKDTTVKLYPNPTAGNVTITADTIVKSVELYDMQGRLLQVNTINDTQATINLTEKPSGLYFVKVITDNGAKVEKIVKE